MGARLPEQSDSEAEWRATPLLERRIREEDGERGGGVVRFQAAREWRTATAVKDEWGPVFRRALVFPGGRLHGRSGGNDDLPSLEKKV